MTERGKAILVNGAVVAFLAVVLVWGTAWYRQWTQLRDGEAALARGDYVTAIAGFDSAIHMYTPGSPLVERAAGELWNTAETLEKRGDRAEALIAYRALRSAFYAVRWLQSPGSNWIARCDARIGVLVSEGESSAAPH